MQHLGVDDVGSGHAAAEDHGDEYQDGQEVVQLMLRPAQDVAHKAGEHHAQDGAQHRDVHGHPQGVEDGLPLAPQVLVGAAGEGLGSDEDLIALRTDDVVVRNGDDENENNGQEAGQCQDQEHQVEQEVRCGIDPVQAAEGIAADRCILFTHDFRLLKSVRWSGPPCAQRRWPSGW